MIAPRRFLPSVSALLAFEAVARLGSATAAGQELALTQSAVSRQLKTLEDQLGVALLQRKGRHLTLTPTGQSYVVEIRSVLTHLGRASISARTNPTGGNLTLAILPAFGMHWLAPRLRDFAQRHPEVTVNLSTRLTRFDLSESGFDAAIHFGHEDWPGVHYLPLMPETVIPVCAPTLTQTPLADPRDILQYPLLHLETRPKAWTRWFASVAVEASPPAGMIFDQFATMAQAAIHGLGVALLPTFFAQPYLTTGKLAPASTQSTQSIGNYYLVWPSQPDESAALRAFRDWIAQQLSQAARDQI